MGLSPGFDEGAANDAGADEGDLGYYSVGLRGLVSLWGGLGGRYCEAGIEGEDWRGVLTIAGNSVMCGEWERGAGRVGGGGSGGGCLAAMGTAARISLPAGRVTRAHPHQPGLENFIRVPFLDTTAFDTTPPPPQKWPTIP